MLDFFVVGSGISGSTIAYLLSKRFKVEVFDKAKGSGGRSSNKKLKDNLSFDHGLQYISPKSKLFQNYISKLTKKKILKIWDGNHLDFTFQKGSSDKRYIGFKGNNDLSKYCLKNIKQNYSSEVESIKFNNIFWEIKLKNEKILQAQSIIFTCPFPQLKRLANKYLDKRMSKLPILEEPLIEDCHTGFASLIINLASSSICTQSANASWAFSISIEFASDQSVNFILTSPSSLTGSLSASGKKFATSCKVLNISKREAPNVFVI